MEAIYIHVPFCRQICSYCAFCKRFYNEKEASFYLDKLIEEINNCVDFSSIYKTLYIGGGTPSCLSKEELNKLFTSLKNIKLALDYEFTFEMNPEDISEELLIFLKENRVNRLSIGIQSFNENNLKLLNRPSINMASLMLVKKYFANFSLDLIYGIDTKILKEDLEKLLMINPPHVSLYSLMIEDNTLLKINNFKKLSEEDEIKEYYYIINKLKEAGYKHYEISNFAKDGYESKHNLTYWENREYLGLGLGASSFINGSHLKNTSVLSKYPSIYEETKETKTSLIEYEVMLGLRLIKGLSLEEFKHKYLLSLDDLYNYDDLLEEGLLKEKNNYLFIPEEHLYLENYIINRLLTTKRCYEIIDVLDDGRGVAKYNQKTYFISDALFKEVVTLKDITYKKNYIEASRDELIQMSPYYTKARCLHNYKESCSSLQNIEYEKGLDLKVNNALKKLKDFGGVDTSYKVIEAKETYNYRNKVTFKIKRDGESFYLGYHLNKTNEFSLVDSLHPCELLSRKINEVVNYLYHLDTNPFDIYLKNLLPLSSEIMIRELSGLIQIDIKTNNYKPYNYGEDDTLYLDSLGIKNISINGKDVYGEFLINLYNLNLKVSTNSFMQVNKYLSSKLYEEAINSIDIRNKNVLDLYSGIGITSLIMAKNARSVTGVELNKEAVKDANTNKELNNIDNVTFLNMKAEDYIKKMPKDTDLVLVDPPRKGLDKKIIEVIGGSNIKEMLYISCNPATLGRDIKLLKEYNYNVLNLTFLDMFPYTMHVETIVLLAKKGR